MESFEGIHLDLSQQPGKCRIAESGLGWKPSAGGDTFTLDGNNIGGAQWSRAAKGFELKILSRTSGVIQLDGFDQEVKALMFWKRRKTDSLRTWTVLAKPLSYFMGLIWNKRSMRFEGGTGEEVNLERPS